MDVSSSTVRSELAELEALGLLTHPHTSAGRVPTESGYRVYAEQLVEAIEGRPERVPRRRRDVRSELEEALRSTTETLSQATRLLALVSAPALESAVGPSRRGSAAPAARGDRRRDHLDRRRHEARARARPSRRSGARRLGPRLPRGDRSSGCGSAPATLRRRLEDPALPPHERAFLGRLRTAFVDAVADDGPSSTSVVRQGCSATRAGPSWRRASTFSTCSSGAPPSSSSCRTRSTRSGRSSASAPRSRAGSCATSLRRRDVRPPEPLARLGRLCSGRSGWTTTRRSAPFGPRRSSCRGSSRTSTRTSSEPTRDLRPLGVGTLDI